MIDEGKIIASATVQAPRSGAGSSDELGALVTGADYRGLGVVRSLGVRQFLRHNCAVGRTAVEL